MVAAKGAVTIDAELLRRGDGGVGWGDSPSRSRAVQAGLLSLRELRARRRRLLRELAKLDPDEERALAEEALAGEAQWPAV